MIISKIYSLVFILLLLPGCASTPENINLNKQFAFVVYNNEGGNQIVIPNLDEVKYYNLYRQSMNDSSYILLKKVQRPLLPIRGRLGPYAIVWLDDNFYEQVQYKIEGLKDDGEIWFDVQINYTVPKQE